MKLVVPELSLVILVGASGSGKSAFARKHFNATEILSSDAFRAMVRDDEGDQEATQDAFDVLHYVLAKRLAAGRLTVVDATNVQATDRRSLLKLAKQYHVQAVAIALNLPESVCQSRNQQRKRKVPVDVVINQVRNVEKSLLTLAQEKFRHVYVLNSPEDIEFVEIIRQPLSSNLKHDHGPFDIIGDIHGCCDELEALLKQLGYETEDLSQEQPFWNFPTYHHPEGRKALFLGDLVDRGPRILDTVRLVHNMIAAGSALCILGNHENKLMRKLSGKKVKLTFGLAETVAEIEAIAAAETAEREDAIAQLQSFFNSMDSHYVLDDGKLVAAHAGLRKELQGRRSGHVHNFAMYGETTGETDKFGLPVRYEWATEYKGKAAVVYGHTPVAEAVWLNNTIDIDTGCVFGGRLTALRYPEKTLVSIKAAKIYCRPVKPLSESWTNGLSPQSNNGHDHRLNVKDFIGKKVLSTRLYRKITLREENVAAALEAMSRFTVNPKWLIYLPPTIAPVDSSKLPDVLEHPAEAFGYYRSQNVSTVMCQEKHAGSRAVVIVCRSEAVVKERFGIENSGIGICYTRTGRRFFDEPKLEFDLLSRLNTALDKVGFWKTHSTDWVCLDCELMPWSLRAQGLLKNRYVPVGVAAKKGLGAAIAHVKEVGDRADVSKLLTQYQQRSHLVDKYVSAYSQNCWPVDVISDIKLAPFHILATEGKVYTDKTHEWHMAQILQIVQADPDLLLATRHKTIHLQDQTSCEEGIQWWESLTGAGSEGMLVKPMDFIHCGQKGFAQPALKCRSVEALRLVYGPDYTLPENLSRLKKRGEGKKRAIALREFSLGVESLERFVAKEPLSQVHECIFGILALESEPIDPRL